MTFIPAFKTSEITSDFLSLISHGWVVTLTFQDTLYSIYISQLVRFARCCTSVLDFHSKTLQNTSKLLTQGYRYHKLRKTFGKFFRSYSELLSKFGDISFQENLSKGILHPVVYGDLLYKLRKVKDTPNFISSDSKIVKRFRRRQYDPLIIGRTIGLCVTLLQICTYISYSIALWLTRRWGLYDGTCQNLRGERVLIFFPCDC